MSEAADMRDRKFWKGVAASALLHVLVAAAFLVHFAPKALKPEEQTPIQVQLVDPPKKDEQKKQPPSPPEQKSQKPPQPEKKPEAEKKPASPPPPPQPQQQQADTRDNGAQPPLKSLDPVFRYGDTEAAGQKNLTGNSSSGEAKDATSAAIDAAEKSATAQSAEAAKSPGTLAPDIELPKADLAQETAKPGAPQAKASVQAVPDAAKGAAPDMATNADTQKDKPDLKPAKTLYSPKVADGAEAMKALAGIPRYQRISDLCTTELREQLRHGSPPYRPALLPAYRLREGNVLDVPNGAFRTISEWYNLSFRCEVDADATHVVSFAFRVGDPVPRDQWRARGFPE